MKLLKCILTGVALLAIGCILFTWWDNRNYFERGETDSFTINVGETVQFQLPENGSTGYQNCWINPINCTSLVLVSKSYSSSLQSKLGYIGSGGRITFKFRGIKKGIDTVAIASCPTAVEGKDCSEFSTKSVKPDNTFVVNVQ